MAQASSFPVTRWSLVVAGGGDGPAARAALESLCQVYWYPLYAFLRRRGHPADQAEDLVQGCFLSLLERQGVSAARQERGRFRSFLLTVLKHHVADDWDRQQAAKRGGGRVVRFDPVDAEDRFRREPEHHDTPEAAFDRSWAMQVLDETLSALAHEQQVKGQSERFATLKPLLLGDSDAGIAAVGERIGLSPTAAKVAVHRLRSRWRELLRERIADTVANDGEVDDEVAVLLAAVARPTGR